MPASTFVLLVVVRGMLGFGQAITNPAGASVLADYYGIERRGKAFSLQYCLSYVGLGLGLVIGSLFGTHFGHFGWRLAFLVSIVPGLVIAWLCFHLPEPKRGAADRAHVTGATEMEVEHVSEPLFPGGIGHFTGQMFRGLRDDMRTILRIPTMRYALIGVSNIFFVVTAVSTWMPTFYERQFGLTQGKANLAFGALAIVAGIPGTLIGGAISDRFVSRVLGSRVVIPGVCLGICATLFLLSFIPMPFAPAFALELLGFLVAASSLPALRAGLADAVPAQLRSTGSGAFNVTSIIFGSAAAPLLTSAVATQFGGNYRVAFSIVMPVAFTGCIALLLARRHIEKDTAAVFEAISVALEQQKAESPPDPA